MCKSEFSNFIITLSKFSIYHQNLDLHWLLYSNDLLVHVRLAFQKLYLFLVNNKLTSVFYASVLLLKRCHVGAYADGHQHKWVPDSTYQKSQISMISDKKSIGNEVVFSETLPQTGSERCTRLFVVPLLYAKRALNHFLWAHSFWSNLAILIPV